MKMNIVLIGMPYSGKSTLGKKLAKKFDYNFIDTDRYIEKREGKKIIEIFKEDGEREFKRIEEKRILELKPKRCVIATGGSVILSPNIMEHLKKNAVVIYLKMSYEELARRASLAHIRGIVGLKELKSLKKVYGFREPLYEKYADKIIFQKKNQKENIKAVIDTTKDL